MSRTPITMIALLALQLLLGSASPEEPDYPSHTKALLDVDKGASLAAQDTPRRFYMNQIHWKTDESSEWVRDSPFLTLNFTMMKFLAEADVLLIGEHHADPATHRLQLDILNSIYYQRPFDEGPTLAMEMFERDTQPYLGWFSWVSLPEVEFLAAVRPWSNLSDYIPLISKQFGIHHEINPRLVASNAPTSISRRVAREGLEAVLPTLSAEERSWIAAETSAPRDEYWERFVEAMGGGASDASHGHHMGEDALYRFYQAQCLKDDTMAETIARLREADPARPVIHISGSFHVEYELGIVPRLKALRPDDVIVTLVIKPVPDIDDVDPAEYADVAPYIAFVPAPVEVAADEPAGAVTGEGAQPTEGAAKSAGPTE